MVPMIIDEDGQVVYGTAYVSRDYALEEGMAAYARGLAKARDNPRVGSQTSDCEGLENREGQVVRHRHQQRGCREDQRGREQYQFSSPRQSVVCDGVDVVVSAVRTWRIERAEKVSLKALTLICCMGFFLGGCGPRSGLYPESTLGTPEHHVFNGFALLRMERAEDAQREFEQALRLDPRCSGAYRGIGWIEGQKGDFSAAFASMTQAKEIAEKNRGKSSCRSRVHGALHHAEGF